ncbi:MAG: amidohydrolase [Solirubrobacterales bacterium]
MLLIKNGKIVSMESNNYSIGSILIDKGKIVKVQSDIELCKDYEIIDAKDCWVLPGLIDAHCHIGIMDENSRFEGRDANEGVDPVTPQMRAIDGINPMDQSFYDARKAGITTVMTGPGSANVIGGQFAVIKTWGRIIDEMIIKAPAAMKVSFGENPKKTYNGKNKSPVTRMGIAALLRETFLKTENYKARKNKAIETNQFFERDIKLEALLPVLNGEIPIKAHVHRADDIVTALRIAKEFNIKITLEHCTEGFLITDLIEKSNAAVIAGPLLTPKSKDETKNKSASTPGILMEAGIKTAICTDHPVVPISHLALNAGVALREGLDFHEALKSITINAAEILGIQDTKGSIIEGKDADIAIFDGNPLEITTNTLYTIIQGEIVYTRR